MAQVLHMLTPKSRDVPVGYPRPVVPTVSKLRRNEETRSQVRVDDPARIDVVCLPDLVYRLARPLPLLGATTKERSGSRSTGASHISCPIARETHSSGEESVLDISRARRHNAGAAKSQAGKGRCMQGIGESDTAPKIWVTEREGFQPSEETARDRRGHPGHVRDRVRRQRMTFVDLEVG